LSVLSVAAGSLAAVVSMAAPSEAGTVTFGSGSNQFNMEFVTIGNPNNAADTTGQPNLAGAVGYTYGIGKFEVSEEMITKYNSNFGTDNRLVINTDNRGAAKPATNVSLNEAARFVNWLNTSTGNQAAYKFTTSGVNDDIELWTPGDAGWDVNNQYRNSLAKYFLPSENEWYKAAFYDPNKSGGAGYWDYATGSDTGPIATTGGTVAGTAVYGRTYPDGPADVANAGGLSKYGVMGLGGNANEWLESFLAADDDNPLRGIIRGGTWFNSTADPFLSSSSRTDGSANLENGGVGFRVASLSSDAAAVPEPSMMVIGTLFGLGGLMAKRRMKK